jgi:tRNA pseudouridine38-40 synthase
MRVRAVVAYDGTEYGGFQRQANAFAVQEALEDALAQVTQEEIRLWAAGRTDAGVHALGQAIAFDTAWRHPVSDLQRALNAVLPEDVAVRALDVCAPDFHPRYDAQSRCYRYKIYQGAVRCPFCRRYSLHIAYPLDVALMEQAAQCLVGVHDFAAFGRSPTGGATVREVFRAQWREDPPYLYFDVEGNAFLYRMVRSIVGTLLQVGYGKLDAGGFEAVLASRDRSQSGPVAPPHGLYLMEVKY